MILIHRCATLLRMQIQFLLVAIPCWANICHGLCIWNWQMSNWPKYIASMHQDGSIEGLRIPHQILIKTNGMNKWMQRWIRWCRKCREALHLEPQAINLKYNFLFPELQKSSLGCVAGKEWKQNHLRSSPDGHIPAKGKKVFFFLWREWS